MRRNVILIAMLITGLALLSLPALSQPPADSGYKYCPYCGRSLGGEHRTMKGSTHGGWAGGPYRPGASGGGEADYPDYRFRVLRPVHGPQDITEAEEMMERLVASTNNPNLKVGRVEDKKSVYEGRIVTKEGENLVDILHIDKRTGRVRSLYDE